LKSVRNDKKRRIVEWINGTAVRARCDSWQVNRQSMRGKKRKET
jgi:hypothetical protein